MDERLTRGQEVKRSRVKSNKVFVDTVGRQCD